MLESYDSTIALRSNGNQALRFFRLHGDRALILLKITQVNSQPLLLLKEDELSPPRSDDKTMQPQSESPLDNQLDFKNCPWQRDLKIFGQV